MRLPRALAALACLVGALCRAEPPPADAAAPSAEPAPQTAPAAPASSSAPAVRTEGLPSFAELEAAGATIGEIRITANDIFDTSDPAEDKWLFRAANRLHIQTRPGVIERALLFKRGERVSERLVAETERTLRSNRFLYDVQIRPLALHENNVVDIEVVTRDTWSLDFVGSASRQGGANAGGVRLREVNLLGTGITVGFGHSRNVDRTSNDFLVSNPRLFGSWTSLALSHAANSDGKRDAVALVRPFYALDTRWAAGLTAYKDNRVDPVYVGGQIVSQYRHRQERAEAFAGYSAGLREGWVQRWSAGLSAMEDEYAPEPGLVAPAQLGAKEKLVSPFVRWELIEDRFERELNRNLIGRPEFFALGLAASVQLGVASHRLGSTNATMPYAASLGRGFEPAEGHLLTAAARVSGQYFDGKPQRQQFGTQVQYYLQQSGRWLFTTSLAADWLTRPEVNEALLLGGDNGLRGYPLRYQTGQRRVLATVEERFFTDLYVWRLFRVGGAAYLDTGRAWGGALVNSANPGWLTDIGMGLRIVNARSAFGEVLHIDLAVPLHATPDMKHLQLLVKSKTSF